MAFFAVKCHGYSFAFWTILLAMIQLQGNTLTIDEVIRIARHREAVSIAEESLSRMKLSRNKVEHALHSETAVYALNTGVGLLANVRLEKASIEQMQLNLVRSHCCGVGNPLSEDVVRAMMLVRANAMTHNAPSPQLAQMLLDLLNQRITPVVQSRGTVGEGDLAQLGNIAGVMVGAGEAYYQGVRMPAAQALARAGLKPIQPFAADENALTSSNAYATGQAALVVDAARRALEWADVIYTMDLNGMNSSITPLSLVVQCDRPGLWLNWDADRILRMLKGSYLFDGDARIIQDPESLRASSIRAASAWEAWAQLREAVLFQANSSDHNPAVHVGLGPDDSWELATPQMMKYFVKGGPQSHGQHGYIVSNANWDPYPLANHLESFVLALGNLDIAVTLRIDRFTSPFFTVVEASQVLPDIPHDSDGYTPPDLQQEI